MYPGVDFSMSGLFLRKERKKMDSEKYQITKLEDMVYCEKGLRGKLLILAYGQIDGRYFFILKIGGDHPTAYVEVMISAGDKVGYDDLSNIDVHGGITFGPDYLYYVTEACQEVGEEVKEALDREYIGWDYGHTMDFVPWAQRLNLDYHKKKWNVDEIMEDVVSVADQLEKARKRG